VACFLVERQGQTTAKGTAGILRFAQDDDIKQATASAEADPYGMTNKRQQQRQERPQIFRLRNSQNARIVPLRMTLQPLLHHRYDPALLLCEPHA